MPSYNYTPTYPPSNQFSNTNLNALAGFYATQYGYDTTDLIARDLAPTIYNSAPQQYFADLRILGMAAAQQKKNDEFQWVEAPYNRDPIVSTASNIGGTQTITIQVTPASVNPGVVSINTLVAFQNGQTATVTGINPTAATITLTAQTGLVCPAINNGDFITNVSTVEADGMPYISTYDRLYTIERTNYVQMFSRAMRFGKQELYKWYASGTTNYLEENQRNMIFQHRVDLQNAYWQGVMGEVTLSDGNKAKTMGGILDFMQKAGSLVVNCTTANIGQALEYAALNSQYKLWGSSRMLYATPTLQRAVSAYYRDTLQRYYVGDTKAELYFPTIDMGSEMIHQVPMQRFQDSASFPRQFSKYMFLIDQESIMPAYTLQEEMGTTLARTNNGTLNNFQDTWISCTQSIIFNNPLGCALIVVD